jgi:sugar/nucleoside kinase (ribokinase family)
VAPTVSVIGDALLDVHAAPSTTPRPGEDVPARVRLSPGGQGANLAVRLARRGVPVTLICALADDVAGRVVRAALEADGVTLHAIEADATGVVVVLVDDRGDRTMLSQRVPFAAAAEPAASDWLLVSGYVLLEPAGEDMARSVAGTAGRRVLVGCAVPDDRAAAWRSAAMALAPDLVVMNAGEADRLGIEGAHGIAVTDAGGATATIGMASADVRVPPGSEAVDTTGAGDAFAAALVSGLLDAEWPPGQAVLEGAVREAVELASAVARAPGAQARMEPES